MVKTKGAKVYKKKQQPSKNSRGQKGNIKKFHNEKSKI
jgi:hypothetical protein